ncbi:MAG: M28 family metallopeptidase [Sulfurospirillum cavolei]|nr:M28 family metallopeptidase [Sulfurospirillum cavolei]
MTQAENTILDMHQEKSKEEILRLRLPDSLSKTSSASDKKSYTPPPEDFDTPPLKKKAENELDLPVLKRNGSSEEPTFYRNKEEQIDATLLPPPPPLEESKTKGVIKIESKEINSISYLKEKFDTTHNIVFALMLAEEYYLSKNYVESNKWALIANNLDAENEKSWIWFAKSKVKLGQKEDAILALKTYLKKHKIASGTKFAQSNYLRRTDSIMFLRYEANHIHTKK